MHESLRWLTGLLLVLFSLALPAQESGDDALPFVQIQRVDDLRALGERARREGKIILMEIEASDCPYCRKLEEEILKPMLRSGDYDGNTLIVQLEIDGYGDLTDWNGGRTTPADFARRHGVFVTPTLLFLDADGREVSKRIVGINSVDYFGAYVDDALAEGRKRMRQTQSALNDIQREQP